MALTNEVARKRSKNRKQSMAKRPENVSEKPGEKKKWLKGAEKTANPPAQRAARVPKKREQT